MSKFTRSARGETVDFDILAIKKQLASTPVPVSVNARRTFIDERDGLKTRENHVIYPEALSPERSKELSDEALMDLSSGPFAIAAGTES